MNRAKAQRIRFGILAARHQLERGRLTDWQTDYLEGCEASGWAVRDARRAYEREVRNARCRMFMWRPR